VSTPETARSTSQTARGTSGTASTTASTAADTSATYPVPGPRRAAAGLTGDHENTTIADLVVAKVCALAAREVDGVYAMGGGVAVEVGAQQAAADIDLVVEYGVSIPDLAVAVRNNVINAVERICGLEVTEVNIGINDIHLPGEQDVDTSPRVR
jgi:uncharacterized alkaline shock family protein YloU